MFISGGEPIRNERAGDRGSQRIGARVSDPRGQPCGFCGVMLGDSMQCPGCKTWWAARNLFFGDYKPHRSVQTPELYEFDAGDKGTLRELQWRGFDEDDRQGFETFLIEYEGYLFGRKIFVAPSKDDVEDEGFIQDFGLGLNFDPKKRAAEALSRVEEALTQARQAVEVRDIEKATLKCHVVFELARELARFVPLLDLTQRHGLAGKMLEIRDLIVSWLQPSEKR
jgi:ATPase (PilT family)